LFLLHPFSLSDLQERVNFQRAYRYILLDVIPVFLYNKTERAKKNNFCAQRLHASIVLSHILFFSPAAIPVMTGPAAYRSL